MSWRRLAALIAHLPRESATARAIHGEKVDWSTTDHLLAHVVDLLAGGNWQRGGGKGLKPKPLQRPGQVDNTTRRIGSSTTLPLDEARRRLDKLHGRTAKRKGGG